jgi:acyl-CoA thioesterase
VWGVGPNEGLEHDHAPAPDVPPADDLPTPLERLAAAGIEPMERPFPFWENFDERPIDWIDDWENRVPGAPEARGWYRFAPVSTFDDLWLDACRGLILVDTFTWPAAVRAHTGMLPWMAPSLDLAVQFHHDPADQEWLLVKGTAPVAQRGTIGCENHVWASDGRLIASGSGSLLCTPAPIA